MDNYNASSDIDLCFEYFQLQWVYLLLTG